MNFLRVHPTMNLPGKPLARNNSVGSFTPPGVNDPTESFPLPARKSPPCAQRGVHKSVGSPRVVNTPTYLSAPPAGEGQPSQKQMLTNPSGRLPLGWENDPTDRLANTTPWGRSACLKDGPPPTNILLNKVVCVHLRVGKGPALPQRRC